MTNDSVSGAAAMLGLDDDLEYYVRLSASIGRDLLVAMRDVEDQTGPDSTLIKRLAGDGAETFAGTLSNPESARAFGLALKQQFEFLEYASRLVDKSDAEVQGGANELQSFSPAEIEQIAPFVFLCVTAFSLLFSFRAGPGGTSINIPNNDLIAKLIEKNTIASVIYAIRGKRLGDTSNKGDDS